MIEHMEDVVGLLFRYITLLQTSGAPKWIFDEVNLFMNLSSIFC
jgi:secreted Zn-dependent insulinase-like peptidase